MTRTIKPLTDTKIRNAKPADKTKILFDGGGLYLEITTSGSKLWLMKYRFDGKEDKLSFGRYPGVSLEQTPKKRQEARSLLANDTNPAQVKKAQKAARQERAANSFEVVVRKWMKRRKDDISKNTYRTLPYKAAGDALKPVSDKALENIVDPAVKNFVQSVKNKQPVNLFPETEMVDNWTGVRKGMMDMAAKKEPFVATPETDQVNTIGTIKDGIGSFLNKAYTKENYIAALDGLNYGQGRGHRDDFENPDTDAFKGFEKTYRGMKVNLVALRQMGNKIFDPEGKYLDTKELGEWIKDEEAYLANTKVPELADFTKLDWKNNPDKVIELGGKYFRQNLLGTYAFGYAADLIKGRAGPVADQAFGTLTGIARIYCQKDDLAKAALAGTAGNSAAGWDFLVERATANLPITSRQAIRFLNHVMTDDAKKRMFDMVTGDLYPSSKDRDSSVSPTGNADKRNQSLSKPMLKKTISYD